MNEKSEEKKINFNVFISGLMAEGLAALGLFKHPAMKQIKKDLNHASMVIDTLVMFKEKTEGNLTKEESDNLEEVIHQLRMAFIAGLNQNPSESVEENTKQEKDPSEK